MAREHFLIVVYLLKQLTMYREFCRCIINENNKRVTSSYNDNEAITTIIAVVGFNYDSGPR